MPGDRLRAKSRDGLKAVEGEAADASEED